MNLAALFRRSRRMFSEFWAQRDARERAMLAMAALVVAFGIVYALLIDPALSGRDGLNKDLPCCASKLRRCRHCRNRLRHFPANLLPRCRRCPGWHRGGACAQRIEAAKRDADR